MNWEREKLRDLEFLSVDLETTGVSPFRDSIVEIGYSLFNRDQLLGEVSELIKPGRSIPPEVVAIHGITNDMVVDAPPLESRLAGYLRDFEGRVILAHNANFDMAFLARYIAELDLPFPDARVLCTLDLSRKLLKGQLKHNLRFLKNQFQISSGPDHRALSDARAAALVFQNLLDNPRTGIRWSLTLEQVRGLGIPVRKLSDYSLQKIRESFQNNPVFRKIQLALQNHEPVRVHYQDARGSWTERSIIPRQLMYAGREVKIRAWCLLREDDRHFNLSRMRLAPDSGETGEENTG